jgi:hypothetical protein
MSLTKVTRATTLIKDGWGAFNTLIDDLLSVASGKGASQVGIEDTAGNMSAANVEDALAEIYTDHATTKTLAETFDENSATTTGLVWGYKSGLFRLDSTVTTVSAGTIALTDDATDYIEIDPSDGLVKKNTTSFTSGRIPLRTIVTASGVQTTSTDKRAWFSQVAAATTTTSGIMELATDAETITGTATDRVVTPANITAKLSTIANTYGVSWNESADTYVRTGSLAAQACSQTLANALLPIQAAMRRCILNDAGEVQYYLGATDSTKREDGVLASVLDGTDGQVMTQIPKFHYKYGYSGTTHTWEISLTPAAGFSIHPAFIKNGVAVDYRYIGTYEGIGYDNGTTAYIDCGTAAANNWAGGAIDLANDKLGSVSGFAPMMEETRAEFRAIAANRGTGWRQQDFDLVSAIQLLYITEYADWNSQLMIGEGRTALSGGTWVKDSYIGVTGKSNADGNGTNSVGGNTNNAYMTYRGIENFFGNIWKWVDGININGNVPYVSNNDVKFCG